VHYPIVAAPYRFVPPHHGRLWPKAFRPLLPAAAWRYAGVAAVEVQGADRLRESQAAGHGIMLCPNHPRSGDPLVVARLSADVRHPFYYMAAWYLFTRFYGLSRHVVRRLGGFSVFREGLDREALRTATTLLADARRPLVVFPEGVVTRVNDRVLPLLDGAAFVARSAARERARAGRGPVVVHPVAIKYYHRGDVNAAAGPVLDALEDRLTWRRRGHRPLVERVYHVAKGVMALKEIELLGQTQEGTLPERIARYIDALLTPLEKEWGIRPSPGGPAERVKRLRMAIVPDLAKGELDEAEKARRWRHLSDVFLAQAASCYPGDYIASRPTAERVLETLERFEEDITGRCRVHRPYHAVVRVGEVVPVGPDRPGRGEAEDPLTTRIHACIQSMLDELADGSTPIHPA
jgi:1-acyl-sn-glycerol-3-phosphate acyltransferase